MNTVSLNKEDLTNYVKSQSKDLGFISCGVSKAEFLEDEAPKLERWLNDNMNGEMSYMERNFDMRLDPRKIVDGAKSVISLTYNYYSDKLQKDDSFKISKYAYGMDYHFVLKEKLRRLLEIIKEKESEGYSYDTAQASFELLARRIIGQLPEFFDIKRYKVTVERRKNKYNKMISLSEAVVVVKVDGQKKLSVSESLDELGSDRGPVNALAKALAKDLGQYQHLIDDMRLVDFKVRITQGGTEAVTRVVIDSEDSAGRRWATVGVSANIVDASFDALIDAMNWKILQDF